MSLILRNFLFLKDFEPRDSYKKNSYKKRCKRPKTKSYMTEGQTNPKTGRLPLPHLLGIRKNP